MSKNKVNPGKGYRLLEVGTEIKKEDEVLWECTSKKQNWQPTNAVGLTIGKPGTQKYYRRKVESSKGWNVTFKSREHARFAVQFMKEHTYGASIIRGPHKAQ